MFLQPGIETSDLVRELSAQGYPPAEAALRLAEGRYSRAVEICKEQLSRQPQSVSSRLIYAMALHGAGQSASATEQFYLALSADPENLVALKHLGDIKFAEGDEVAAMANYVRILEIDPSCKGLKADLKSERGQTIRTITLSRSGERTAEKTGEPQRPRIPFYTETIGDLYLAQGHPRLAAEVFRTVNERNSSPRLAEKLAQAERRINEREP